MPFWDDFLVHKNTGDAYMINKKICLVAVTAVVLATMAHVIYWHTRDDEKKRHNPLKRVF